MARSVYSKASSEVDSGDVSLNVDIAKLSDGLLNVTINWKSGDIRFDDSLLEVAGNRGASTAAVPEPASLILVGSGLIALSVLVRKRNRHA
jgi:hypothetical protein